MAEPVVVRVTSLSKAFRLPHQKHRTLKSVIINPFIRGRRIESQEVLRGLSFDIKRGEFLGIVGRNGGGKSTLLKLLAFIYAPTKGKVEISGKLVPFIELGVGFNPELTGRDNVYLNGALLGLSDSDIDEIYDDIVAFAELERFMDQKLKNYSSGMQVRLAFSLATRAEADILLVDEVLAVGDIAFQRKCYEHFSSLKRQGKTVIFISHDMNAVREYCTRALLLDEGKIVAAGTPDEIAEKYMRLMSVQSADIERKPGDNKRWGDKTVHIEAGPLSTDDKKITLQMSITAKKDVRDQVVGFSLHGADGQVICGTNTELLHKKIQPMAKGDRLTLEWEVPNILRDGTYSIGVASHGYGGLPVYDWWNNALQFSVSAGRRSPYAVTPDIKLKIEN